MLDRNANDDDPDNSLISSTITIRGKELAVHSGLFPQAKLKFYVENPRIYSSSRSGTDGPPDQEDIEKRLQDMEHVRELVLDIKNNGGLIEPVIVKPETNEVLEGNSRLAAYRLLAKSNAIKWGLIKCTFLPNGVDENTIFTLLAQFHIKGKKDWAPFEQAGFLYRRLNDHKLPIDTIAKDVGLKVGEAKLFIETYDFMLRHKEDDSTKWSYYLEFLKSNKIKKMREQFEEFDDLIVEKIKNGEIAKATDVRDRLPKLGDGSKSLLRQFAQGQIPFEKAIVKLVDSGADNTAYKKLSRFRKWLAEDEVKQALDVGTSEEKKKIAFELDKIHSRAKVLWNKSAMH